MARASRRVDRGLGFAAGALAAIVLSVASTATAAPAHAYHRALLVEVASGRQDRLGDAILAAQRAYAETGLMPELLAVNQLLGDPAMTMRPETRDTAKSRHRSHEGK